MYVYLTMKYKWRNGYKNNAFDICIGIWNIFLLRFRDFITDSYKLANFKDVKSWNVTWHNFKMHLYFVQKKFVVVYCAKWFLINIIMTSYTGAIGK